jgi:hypothetical protein
MDTIAGYPRVGDWHTLIMVLAKRMAGSKVTLVAFMTSEQRAEVQKKKVGCKVHLFEGAV